MKKQMMKIGMWLFVVLLCVGCSSHTAQQTHDDAAGNGYGVYSNLVDVSSQKEVIDLLESHGVTSEQTDTLLSWVYDFNSRVTSDPLPEGFHAMEEAGMDYHGLIIQNKEAADGLIEPEANCRLTSYLLMKDAIQTNGKHADNDTFLMFDLEAVDTSEPFSLSEEERSHFLSLFSWVPVDGTSTVEEHAARIQNAWKDREIQIDGDGRSLITVYLHSPLEEVRFVGHTGVLLETENGLLFVEKYGPQFPFQATKFQNREELKQYLLGRADLYGDETELPPIIMENEQVLAS